ncbi:hypothetical protein ACXYTP_01945 [Tsukamurella ocularis]|uniref:hypothetical protein n=1 Tax=Tsukamurella ocularis TaxID=1970234 RepID=UPI0039EEC8CE
MLTRGFLRTVHPADGPDEVWIPGRRGALPVARSEGWETAAAGSVLPVVIDADRPTAAVLLDERYGVVGGGSAAVPSAVEALCPAPSVAVLLDAVRATGRGVFPEERPGERMTELQWAVALRLGQLSVYEAHRIAHLGAGTDAQALCARLEAVGPPRAGLSHRPSTVDLALDHLARAAVSAVQLARARAAFAAITRLERRGAGRTLLRAAADPEDVRAALEPFVTVCGPIPGVDAAALPVPPPMPPEEVSAPPELVVRSAPEGAGDGATTLILAPSSTDSALPVAVGDELAVVARQGVTLASVAVGAGCTVHRVQLVTPSKRGGTTVRVVPAVPSHAHDAVRVLPVRHCRAFLAAHPEAGARTVDNRSPQAYRRPAPGLRLGAPAARRVAPARRADPSRRTWFRRRTTAPPAIPAGPSPDALLWAAATAEHDRVLRAYLPYETDPALILSYPAVSDITEPPTADFHDALARAQALRPESGPAGPELAEAYHRAVVETARAWAVCEDHGRRTGHTHQSAPDAADLERAAKLLRHAAGAGTDLERVAYLDRARVLVDDLAGRATVRLGPGARRHLGEFAVAALPGPRTDGDQRDARGAP